MLSVERGTLTSSVSMNIDVSSRHRYCSSERVMFDVSLYQVYVLLGDT